MRSKKRRHIVFVFSLLFLLFLIFYGIFIETSFINIERHHIVNKALSNNWSAVKIGYFTDIHLDDRQSLDKIEKIVNEFNNSRVDIIFCSGFFYSTYVEIDENKISAVADKLRSLQASLGKFVYLDDRFITKGKLDEIRSIFDAADFQILSQGVKKIYKDEPNPINLVTLSDNNLKDFLNEHMNNKEEASSNILLTANDEVLNNLEHVNDFFLTLSYGNYGGNVGIPFINKIFSNKDYCLKKKYYSPNRVHLNSTGISTPGDIKFRLFNKPKLYIIELYNN